MTNDHNSIKEEVVNGVFRLLNNWWLWLMISVFLAMYMKLITQHNLYVVMDKVVEIIKAAVGFVK